MEYHKNILCISYTELTQGNSKDSDFVQRPIMSDANYKKLSQKKKLKIIRRGCYGTPALIEYQTMPTRFKEKYVAKYGNPENGTEKYELRNMIVKDIKAECFFQTYTFDDNGIEHLPQDKQKEYTMNASVLNALSMLISKRSQFIRVRGDGKTRRVWDEECACLKEIQAEKGCNLPENPISLKRKLEGYIQGGYYTLISGKFKNKNASKKKTIEQDSLVRELIGNGRNLDNETTAKLYNAVAERMGWPNISPSTVANYKKEMQETFAGRRGKNAFYNEKAMQVKRSRPTTPLYFWTADGWDTELLYKSKAKNKEGKEITTYHNRPTVVAIIDPYNDYIVGYAIGRYESPALIRQAFRNAFEHARELFGAYYMPWQIQTDNYGGKDLKSFYEQCTKHYTPARVGNAKAKVVEPFFNRFNRKYLRLYANSSGFGIKSRKSIQPSEDFIEQNKKAFPDWNGCIEQIQRSIEFDRKDKRVAYLKRWNEIDKADQLPFEWEDFLNLFGEATEMPHKLHGHGITLQINNQQFIYDCFNTEIRLYGHSSFILRYDPANMDSILAIENIGTKAKPEEGKVRFLLERKYIQPMALKDRMPGDAAELQKIRAYNDDLINIITDKRAKSAEVVQELFINNHEKLQDTLTKFVLTDSTGQHKNVRNEVSGRKIVEQLPPAKESYQIATTEMDFLNEF